MNLTTPYYNIPVEDYLPQGKSKRKDIELLYNKGRMYYSPFGDVYVVEDSNHLKHAKPEEISSISFFGARSAYPNSIWKKEGHTLQYRIEYSKITTGKVRMHWHNPDVHVTISEKPTYLGNLNKLLDDILGDIFTYRPTIERYRCLKAALAIQYIFAQEECTELESLYLLDRCLQVFYHHESRKVKFILDLLGNPDVRNRITELIEKVDMVVHRHRISIDWVQNPETGYVYTEAPIHKSEVELVYQPYCTDYAMKIKNDRIRELSSMLHSRVVQL